MSESECCFVSIRAERRAFGKPFAGLLRGEMFMSGSECCLTSRRRSWPLGSAFVHVAGETFGSELEHGLVGGEFDVALGG